MEMINETNLCKDITFYDSTIKGENISDRGDEISKRLWKISPSYIEVSIVVNLSYFQVL